mmetsp:Transcript_17386/g.54296  ORF Transcript_17386/g.54296 Transcript_17386/m.54296 type:complete len:211 (+) Transcript_17386:14-646(+)
MQAAMQAALGPTLQTTLARMTHVPRTYPFSFSLTFTAAKTGAADAMTQLCIEKRERLDVKRNLAFWLFGAYFLGGVQYWFYVTVLGRWFSRAASFALLPPREKLVDYVGQRQVVQQVAVDMILWEPFVYFPALYATKFSVQGGTAIEAYDAYSRNFYEDVKAMWCAGIPSFTFNFIFCPMWMRVPFIGLYSFFWTTFISFKRGNEKGAAS